MMIMATSKEIQIDKYDWVIIDGHYKLYIKYRKHKVRKPSAISLFEFTKGSDKAIQVWCDVYIDDDYTIQIESSYAFNGKVIVVR